MLQALALVIANSRISASKCQYIKVKHLEIMFFGPYAF